MQTHVRWVALVCLAATMSVPAVARGQQVDLASYNTLLERVGQLEAQMQAAQTYPLSDGSLSLGEGSCCGEGNCNDGCRRRGLYGVYENVIVQPYFSRNTAYFLEDPPPTNDGYQEVPFRWDFDYSPRVELGYICDCGELGVRTRYWQFDSGTSLTASDPNGDIFIAYADDSSGGIGIFGATDAQFQHSLRMDVFDLEAAFRNCDWTFSAGARYARMEQTYTGTELGSEVPERFVSAHDFEGWGLTGAAEVLKPWRCGISVFAKTRASLLYGQSGFFATNPDDDALLVNSNPDDLLAVGEMQLGVDWRRCVGSGSVFFVTLAVEAQYWFNAGTGGPFNNAPFDEGNYQNTRPQDDDLGFLGGNIGLGLMY